ncbi:MAG TPA: hypothetical protein VF647_03985 [Longimicrobium sp.]|jgi:hypothetical protein
MSSLEDLMEAHGRAVLEFEERFAIRAGGGEVLELRPDAQEPGVLLVRMRLSADAPAQRPAPVAVPLSAAAPATPPAVWREPADEAPPVRSTPGEMEEVTVLIAREDAALRLDGCGGFGLPLLEPEERAQLLAYSLIGDVLGGLQTRQIALGSPACAADLRAAEQAFAGETARLGLAAQPRLFREALAQQAPPAAVRAFTSHA